MGADKDLRKARDRFGAMATQLAIRGALLEAGATEFDIVRVTAQLGERLREFKHIRRLKETRRAFVRWVTRQGRLTELFREILPTLPISDSVAGLVLSRLPEYEGSLDGELLRVWILDRARRESGGLYELGQWITEHRKAVYDGIAEVLSTCTDLDKNLDDVADTLASQVWWGVANNTTEVLSHPAPGKLLNRKGYWAARAWKSRRLYDIREKGEVWLKPSEYTIGLNGLQRVSSDEESELQLDVVAEDVIDLDAICRPVIIWERPWTDDDLMRELSRSGPFREDGLDDPTSHSHLMVA